VGSAATDQHVVLDQEPSHRPALSADTHHRRLGSQRALPYSADRGKKSVNREALDDTTLRKAGVPYFRIYDLRSTYATRLSAGGVADEWVTQLLRQGDAKVFKKYSQMKLQMKREALAKLNPWANDKSGSDTGNSMIGFWHSWSENGWRLGQGNFRSAVFSGSFWSHPPGSNRRPANYEERSPAPNAPLALYGSACYQQLGEAALAQIATPGAPNR
jgi:hypothetical protein